MKRIYIVLTVMILAAVFAIRLSGQTNGPATQGNTNIPTTKIAFVDTAQFQDEKQGITRFVNALKTLTAEFKTGGLKDEPARTKRYNEVVSPINKDIVKALDQFAAQRGITLMLDIDKLNTAVLTINPATNVTDAFIAEYNSKYPPTVP